MYNLLYHGLGAQEGSEGMLDWRAGAPAVPAINNSGVKSAL